MFLALFAQLWRCCFPMALTCHPSENWQTSLHLDTGMFSSASKIKHDSSSSSLKRQLQQIGELHSYLDDICADARLSERLLKSRMRNENSLLRTLLPETTIGKCKLLHKMPILRKTCPGTAKQLEHRLRDFSSNEFAQQVPLLARACVHYSKESASFFIN